MGVTGSLTGVNELSLKFKAMSLAFDGTPLAKVALKSVKVIAGQAKRNARRGPTGLVVQNIIAVAGKKATRYGAVAVARAKWKGTGAIFEEWGTGERVFSTMKIPLGKLGGLTAGKVLKSGRFGKGASMGFGGFAFARSVAPMTGTRFFENAVEEKFPEAGSIMEEGCRAIIAEAIL